MFTIYSSYENARFADMLRHCEKEQKIAQGLTPVNQPAGIARRMISILLAFIASIF